MKRIGTGNLFWIGMSVAILVGLGGCGGKTTPPGASFVYGQVLVPEGFGGSFLVLQWKEGLTIVLVDDMGGDHESSGSGSTRDSIWRGKGAARAADGRQVSWRAETADGKTAAFFLDGQSYDLSQGTLFLIRTRGGPTSVAQHKSNPAGRCSDSTDCQLWLENDPLVMQFVQETLGSHKAARWARRADVPLE